MTTEQTSVPSNTLTRWQIAPQFLVRMTGFPVELMHGFAVTAPREPTAVHDDQARLEQEIADVITHLRSVATSETFREAVFLSNPANAHLIERWIDDRVTGGKKIRNGALTTMLYLQRFCMKNDTASFFGPVYWGDIDPTAAANITVAYHTGTSVRRATFITYWAAAELANWALQQAPARRHLIRPRRRPTTFMCDGTIQQVTLTGGGWNYTQVPHRLDAADAAILDLIDGDRSIDAIIDRAHHQHHLAESEILAALERLQAVDLITLGFEIPVGLHEPLNYLRHQLQQYDVAAPQPLIERLATLRQEFQTAQLAERKQILELMHQLFQETTGAQPTRGAGKLYADRSILFEEAERNFHSYRLGHQLWQDLQQLTKILDLLWTITERDQVQIHAVYTAWFQRRFSQQAVSFADYIAAYIDDASVIQQQLDDTQSDVQAFAKNLYECLVPSEATAIPTITHTFADIERFLNAVGGASHDGVVVNPDILLAAPNVEAINAGDYRLVIGEIHADRDLLTHSSVAYFLDERSQAKLAEFVSRQYATAVRPDERVADVVRTHIRKTNAQLRLDLLDVEFEGRSQKSRELVLTPADLEVRSDNGQLRLFCPRHDCYVRLTVMRVPLGMDARSSPLLPFSFARRDVVLPLPETVRYCPRIQVENIVLLRRTWRAAYHEWRCPMADTKPGWHAELLRQMQAMQTTLGLPDRVFAKVSGERKGTYLDFSNYLLVHAFYRLWREHQSMATFSELSPDLDEAWLSDDHGHYFCELRMGFYRSAQPHMSLDGE